MNNYYSYQQPNYTKNSFENNYNANKLYEPYAGYIRGNMFPNSYNEYKIKNPFDIEPANEQAKLLTYLDSFSFAAHDLNLYLDNFPDDRSLIDTFNQYRKESIRLTKEYEQKYGPLFLNSETLEEYPWAWNNLPWPWDYK